MKTGARSNGPASLKVSFSQMVPPNQRGMVREISAVRTAPEHVGCHQASDLMATVTQEADRSRITLVLVAEPFADEPMNLASLKAWYERLGFVEIQAKPCVMARSPQVIQ